MTLYCRRVCSTIPTNNTNKHTTHTTCTHTHHHHHHATQVERSLTIKVSFQDIRGKPKTKKFRDWEARIFQHEYDHLDGVVYIDRLSPEGRALVGGLVVVCVCMCVEGGGISG
jgi:peptide deformylase